MSSRAFRYQAFLSYAHVDRRWARRLARLLETWKAPRNLAGQAGAFGPVPRTFGPVFRDRDELSASAELGATISRALQESAAMVVICSPAAVNSRWVNEEIRAFKALGRGNRVFAFIVDGDPNAADGPEQCFPPALKFRVDAEGQITGERAEPVAADARAEGDGPRRARLRLLAGLLGVGYDDLWHRDQHRRNQRLAGITAASLAGMAIMLALAVTARFAQQDAERRQNQAEALINYQIGKLYEELKTVGRTDLLASLGDEAMRYFASLSPRDTSDEGLALQARALRQIAEVRIDQGLPDKAIEAAYEGYQRSAELVARHPANGQLLFDRAQAEFYIGDAYYVLRRLDEAEVWLTRYRDSTHQLAGMDPTRLGWILERASGAVNLGTLLKRRGKLDQARTIFTSHLKTLDQLREAGFDPNTIQQQIAHALSFLGSVEEASGELAAAEQYFSRSISIFEELTARQRDRQVEQDLGDQLVHLSRILAIMGRPSEAHEVGLRALNIQSNMHDLDPENVSWSKSAHAARRDLCALTASTGRYEAARRICAELLTADAISQLGTANQPVVARTLVIAARTENAAGHPEQALARARQAVDLASAGEAGDGARAAALLGLALTEKGQAFANLGHRDAAAADFGRAYRLLEPHAESSRDWYVIDSFVRAALLAGHVAEASTAIERLDAMGYRPLWRWPDEGI
jgi:tetratricopeptide (TPR) repeat protein